MKKIFPKSVIGLFISVVIFGQFFVAGFFVSPRTATTTLLSLDIYSAWSYAPFNGSWTDDTEKVNNDTVNDFFLGSLSPDYSLYIGMNSKFRQIIINVGTAGIGGAVLWEYWNGGWKNLEELIGFDDPTDNFKKPEGTYTITFADILPSDWVITDVNNMNGPYWVRARTTSGYVNYGYGNQPPKGTRISAVKLGTDSSLTNLLVSVGNLDPVFSSSTLGYTVALPYGTTETPTTTAITADQFANAVIIPAIDVTSASAPNRTTIITVTAEDGTTIKVYTILFNVDQPTPPPVTTGTSYGGGTILTITPTTTQAAPNISSEIAVPQVNDTSVAIIWVTDHPATSRVIYDTVSHSVLDQAPNYGYAFSTGEINTTPMVVNHIVMISGLNPTTTYYFRSISHGSPEAISEEFSVTTGNIVAITPTEENTGGAQTTGEGTIIPVETETGEQGAAVAVTEETQVLTAVIPPAGQTPTQPSFFANVLSALNNNIAKILVVLATILIVILSYSYIIRRKKANVQ